MLPIKTASPFLSTIPSPSEAAMAERLSYAQMLLAGESWAIQTEAFQNIFSIAGREGEGPEAVAAKLGRPLQNTRSVEMRDGVAVVPVTGPIFRYANLFSEISGATSLDILARDFNRALDDPSVKAIVLNIDSPGGQANGIAEFAQMVNRARKPVTACIGGMGASAAYWIAAAAQEVVIASTAMVGSIGAVVGVDTSRPAGVVEIVSSQSPGKRPDVTTPEGRKQIQTRIDALAQVFIEDVATYRGVSLQKVLADFGQGDVRLGADAVRLGMADRVSTFEELLAGLAV
jgi:ClpP class serine protease